MLKISEIDLGSSILSIFILIGFVATALVFIRLTIIAINYIKENVQIDNSEKNEEAQFKKKKKGF